MTSHTQLQITQSMLPRVLEIGCGSGFVICSAAVLLRDTALCSGASAAFTAVDINPAALAATAATLAAHGVKGADLIRCDLAVPLARRLAGCVDLLVGLIELKRMHALGFLT
jgi:methylase of polypeptide subunit release factors